MILTKIAEILVSDSKICYNSIGLVSDLWITQQLHSVSVREDHTALLLECS